MDLLAYFIGFAFQLIDLTQAATPSHIALFRSLWLRSTAKRPCAAGESGTGALQKVGGDRLSHR